MMSNYSLVVMQTDNNWTFDDLISGWNTSTRESEWLEIVPSNPAERIGCLALLALGSDEHCTGVDEVIRFNGQLYIVQDIDLDDFDGDYEEKKGE
jgi:hypothetical protein